MIIKNMNKLKRKLNPHGISYDKLKNMTEAELDLFMKEVYYSEWVKLWVKSSYVSNYLCFTGIWQYVLVSFLSK